MDKLTIGIPKALLYYKYKDLWINFFENLGCNVLISPNTNKEILENGKKFVLDEACLSMKIFMGHVHYLTDKCDFILIPRIRTLKKHQKLCTNFLAIYDLARNTFGERFLFYNIDIENKESEEYAFITLGIGLGFSYRKVKKAYCYAKRYEELLKVRRISNQKVKLATTSKIKILLAGHPYNLYDNLIGGYISNYLEKENIEIIYSDQYDTKYVDQDVLKIAPKNHFTFSREIVGAISSYENQVDGIILLTTFPCGPDSLTNEMIVRSVKIPIITIIIDEQLSDNGLITRLESFTDILKEKKEMQDETKNH